MFWIVDNGSSRRGHASVDRMAKAWPTAAIIHLPTRVLAEPGRDLFSIVRRKVLTTNDFLDLADVVARLEAFEDAKPFNWKQSKKAATATGSHNHRNQVTSRSPRWPVASGEVD